MFLVIAASLSWSLVGVLVKTAALQFDPFTITFARFSIGVLALAVIVLATAGSLRPALLGRWIWIGALGKSVNYLAENAAISIGYAYGSVLVGPVQTIVLLLLGVLAFRERLTAKSWASAAVVLAGVLCIALNGRSFWGMLEAQGWTTLLFVVSGVGAALHILSQKMLLQTMNDVSMNYSVFLWASIVVAAPLPFASDWEPAFVPGAWIAAVALGLITGLSFVMMSRALRTVRFSVAVIVSNLASLFAVVWSWAFLREPITPQIVFGACLLVAGMTLLNWPAKGARMKRKSASV